MNLASSKKKIPCTVGILTHNSEKTLRRALDSVKEFEEIIICDGGSTDDTIEIAKAYNARIIQQDKRFLDKDGRILDFAGVRNQMFASGTLPWFAYVDSDEYLSENLVQDIRNVSQKNNPGAFFVLRRYVWNEKEVGCATTYPNWSMRLIARSSTKGFVKRVHERFLLDEDVVPEYLNSILYVPLGDGRGPNRIKGDYYIRLQVIETLSSNREFPTLFFATVRHCIVASLLYIVRFMRDLIICRGVRMPLAFELERHWYHIRLLIALWKARDTR